jgi:hypothetical protein
MIVSFYGFGPLPGSRVNHSNTHPRGGRSEQPVRPSKAKTQLNAEDSISAASL